jgi:hypothetical protein
LAKIESGELTREQVVEAGETLWGVYREVKVRLRAVK